MSDAAQVAAKKIQAEVDDALTGLIDILDAFDRFRRIGRLATAILADEARFQARLDRAEEESEGRRKTLLEVRAQQVDDWKRAEQAEAEVAEWRRINQSLRDDVNRLKGDAKELTETLHDEHGLREQAEAEVGIVWRAAQMCVLLVSRDVARLHEGPFKLGMEFACEEILERMSNGPDSFKTTGQGDSQQGVPPPGPDAEGTR